MNKFEKMIYKDSVYMERCKDYTKYRKVTHDLFEEIVKTFKIREILTWLENVLRRFQ